MTPGPELLFHPPGALSRSGVLDVGLKCAHSCRFCYYSVMAEAAAGPSNTHGQPSGQPDSQFSALRHAATAAIAVGGIVSQIPLGALGLPVVIASKVGVVVTVAQLIIQFFQDTQPAPVATSQDPAAPKQG